MPTKMYFNTDNCKGVTLEGGRSYNADKSGFIHANDSDVSALKSGGYIVATAGGMPKVSRYYECDACSFSAFLNHCPKCDSSSLRVVEN